MGGTLTKRLRVVGVPAAAIQDVTLDGARIEVAAAATFGAAGHPVSANGAVFMPQRAGLITLTNVSGAYTRSYERAYPIQRRNLMRRKAA